MQRKLNLLGIGFLIIISISLFYILQNTGMTGFAVSDYLVHDEGNNSFLRNITSEEALHEIESAKEIIFEMKRMNFSTKYFEDELLSAEQAYKKAFYADILRNPQNFDAKEVSKARNALSLINWQDLNYNDVLIHIKKIENRKKLAYILFDKINIIDKKISTYNGFSLPNQTIFFAQEAKKEFYRGGFNNSQELINKFEASYEQAEREASTLAGLQRNARGFILNYWPYLLIILIIILIIIYNLNKKIKIIKYKKKLEHLIIEKKVLKDLIKKAQEDRYKKKKLSELVYNIRFKKYKERLDNIEEEIPVIKNRLRKLNKIKSNKKKGKRD